MVALGLEPPYSLEDVKQAYLIKAKGTHPDHGGRMADFLRLQEAFEQAIEHLNFRSSRRDWIRRQAERYIDRERVVAAVRKAGGRVEIKEIRWMSDSFGEDFAQMVDKLVAVHLNGPQIGDEMLDYLVKEQAALQYVHLLDLAGSRISDGALARLCVLPTLRCLDLRDTPISVGGLKPLLQCSRTIRWLNLRGTPISWWSRLKLRRKFRNLTIAVGDGPRKECLECGGKCASASARFFSSSART